jgi:hypothetical protein
VTFAPSCASRIALGLHFAFSLAFQATNNSRTIIITHIDTKIAERNRRQRFNHIYFKRLLYIASCWLDAAAACSQHAMSPSVNQLPPIEQVVASHFTATSAPPSNHTAMFSFD